jgi:hypothetical protein
MQRIRVQKRPRITRDVRPTCFGAHPAAMDLRDLDVIRFNGGQRDRNSKERSRR